MRVCIIGTGLSALTLAKALVNQNVYVDLFTEKKLKKPDQIRTIGISKSNVDFFNNQIANIKKIIWKLKKIEIYTDNFKEGKLLNFEDDTNELFSIIKYCDLIEVLEKSLYKNIYFRKHQTKINLNFLEKYDLVFNTDSSNFLTKKFFNRKIIREYNSLAYTTLIKHEKTVNDTAIQIFTKNGPLAFLPISHNETSIVYSVHNSNLKKNFHVDELIHRYNFKYKIKKIKNSTTSNLKSLSLRSYYYKNILAFGDALHRIHPLAGQGFNMTIRDIETLLNIIEKKFNFGLPLDVSVNYEFEKKSRHKNLIFSNGIDLVHEFFKLERNTNSKVLSKTVKLFGKNYVVNNIFKNIADKGIRVF